MQALVFYNATMAMGDVSCSEALKGESEGIVSPQYDIQEEVFGVRTERSIVVPLSRTKKGGRRV